jgi:hypothetical protein
VDAPSEATPTQAVQHQNKNVLNHRAAGLSAPRSTSAIVPLATHPKLERSPYGTHLLFEDVTSTIYCATDVLEDSIQHLRVSVQELHKAIPSVKLPGNVSLPSPQMVAADNKHHALIKHYTSPSIQEAITVSNASINHLQEAVNRLVAVLSGLPPPDSDSEDSDVLDD